MFASAHERTSVGLEIGVDGSSGRGGTLLGKHIVALSGPGLAEDN